MYKGARKKERDFGNGRKLKLDRVQLQLYLSFFTVWNFKYICMYETITAICVS